LADESSPDYNPDAVFIDGTLGTGGHTRAMLLAHPTCRVVAFDRDAESQAIALRRLAEEGLDGRVTLVHGDFRFAPELLRPYFDNQKVGSDGRPIAAIHGALVDAGMSLLQVTWSERGLSFNREGPLDMRYNRNQGVSAADLVNRLSESELEDLLFRLADERWARRIAATIAAYRQKQPIRTTAELARLVEEAIPAGVRHQARVHPATKTFAALRLAVNDEFWALDLGSWALASVLAPSARLVILTYSSNEDRTIKRTFRRLAGRDPEEDASPFPSSVSRKRVSAPKRTPTSNASRPTLTFQEISIELPYDHPKPVPEHAAGWGKDWTMKIVTPKPVEPTAEEISANPLARSCKLRAVEKVEL
jgi:16S rRNA (cytosine1402-N4)-methyltransferase